MIFMSIKCEWDFVMGKSPLFNFDVVSHDLQTTDGGLNRIAKGSVYNSEMRQF